VTGTGTLAAAPVRATISFLASAVLAAGAVAWAAVPMSGAHAGGRPVLAAAVACAFLAVLRLAGTIVARRPGRVRTESGDLPQLPGLVVRAWAGVRAVAWAEGMTVAVLVLEALHPARPWHTAALGVIVLAFLLVLHLAETGARPGVLRPQVPLIAAGLALAALSAAAATLRAGGTLLAVIAAAAAVAVAALALPV